ncbi:MAG TPA: hypothetical protein VFH61_05590 [Thermoleophilia bacterium]|nr:hypothetical protein [Thermoleophilia bacterium]
MSRWVLWQDLRKAAAFAVVFHGFEFIDAVLALPAPSDDLDEQRLRASRGVMMSAVEVNAIVKVWPLVKHHMDLALIREGARCVEGLKQISAVDLMASLG